MSNTRVRMHPVLGILVCTDGHVMVPANGTHKAHWTFGCDAGKGYRQVRIGGKLYQVHRLVAETFIPNPENLPTVDHINRVKTNNVENLRWASHKMQIDNRSNVDASIAKYGIRRCENRNAYQKAYYKNNPEFAERARARSREYYNKHKNENNR